MRMRPSIRRDRIPTAANRLLDVNAGRWGSCFHARNSVRSSGPSMKVR